MSEITVPVLGFIAWSGTGKTTLLTRLIPILKSEGLRLALIKHAHHHFDIDHPGKDSHRLRKAGADQIVIASKHRMATIREMPENQQEPQLEEILAGMRLDALDLILVEGFKMADIPKIELHRRDLSKPYLYPDDKHIIALAQDELSATSHPITHLDLNQPRQIADFVLEWVSKQASKPAVSLVR